VDDGVDVDGKTGAFIFYLIDDVSESRVNSTLNQNAFRRFEKFCPDQLLTHVLGKGKDCSKGEYLVRICRYYTNELHSDAHVHRDRRVWIIALHNKVGVLKVLNILDIIPGPSQLREGSWLPLKLQFQGLNMIPIYMSVTKLYNELARCSASDMS
jgi:hypothetical protein